MNGPSRMAGRVYREECKLNDYDSMSVTFEDYEGAPKISFDESMPYLRAAVVGRILMERDN